VSDDVRRWSDELARDPSSMIFLQLGEALRRQGQVELALKVAVRGLERRPHNADAHDLLARIYVDQGDLERAFDEWDMVLRLSPGHSGALKGMGFVYFRQGQLDLAERFLSEASLSDAEDPSITAAIDLVRRRRAGGEGGPKAAHPSRTGGDTAAVPADDARAVFDDVVHGGARAALLLDAAGLVLAGSYRAADGRDVAQEVGAELSGVSDEARRAMRHLGLGDWSSIVLETSSATVALAPAASDGLLVLAAAGETPLGLVRRLLDRAGATARRWLGEGA
jgi:predicted regulator of Ras-like GTPase activity (Roadblock/LC7/MglB family)